MLEITIFLYRFNGGVPEMKYETEIRELLISNTIHLIAEGGFEKATTKELTHCGGDLPNMKMNEVYLYRIFGSKENLYDEAFVRLDRELCYAFRHGAEIVGGFLPIINFCGAGSGRKSKHQHKGCDE